MPSKNPRKPPSSITANTVVDNETRKRTVLDLIDAGKMGALIDNQDGGENIEVVFSRKRGQKTQAMEADEAEEFMDAAIRAAWRLMGGEDIDGDAVEFINEER